MNDLDERLRDAFAARAERTTIDYRDDIGTKPVIANADVTPTSWRPTLAIAAAVVAITMVGVALIQRPSADDIQPGTIPLPAPALVRASIVLAEDVTVPGGFVQFDVVSDGNDVGTGFETFLETRDGGDWKRIWQLSETLENGTPSQPAVDLRVDPDPGIVGGARLGLDRTNRVWIPRQVSPGEYRLCRDLRGQNLAQTEVCADLTIASEE